MAIGPVLQKARLKKQLTTSQVAEMTRMKVQIVDDLEHDDFHRIAATIYGKGFIKLFAECVDLDPTPLIADYLRSVKGETAIIGDSYPNSLPSVSSGSTEASVHQPAEQEDAEQADTEAADDLFSYANAMQRRGSKQRELHTPPVQEDTPEDVASEPTSATARWVTRVKDYAEHAMSVVCQRGRAIAESLVVWLRNRLSSLQGNDKVIKTAGVTLVVIAVVVVTVGLFRSLASRSDTRPPADHELLLLMPPPEPYFE